MDRTGLIILVMGIVSLFAVLVNYHWTQSKAHDQFKVEELQQANEQLYTQYQKLQQELLDLKRQSK